MAASRALDPSVARFSKHFDEDWLFRATLRNSLRACAAARRSSCLQVPQVLGANPRERRIDYELLTGWHPIRAIIRRPRFGGLPEAQLRHMFLTIGIALAEFHHHTHRIHGDFDFDNVLVRREAERIVFVDFTPPEYARFRDYNRLSPYRDIATFLLFVRAKYPPQLLHLAFRPQVPTLARAFIEGYFRTARMVYDSRELERCTNELLESTYLGRSFAARFLRRTRLFRVDDLAP
ncbi:MAG TPA: hypothetical protein VF161_08315 [Steroidobacteraceae bacterium]